MALKAKGFEGHRISVIEDEINKFLAGLDEKNFVDLKFVLGKQESTSPPEYFAAIVIYKA